MKFLTKTSKNWLFYLAIGSMLMAVSLLLIFDDDLPQGSRNFSDLPFKITIIIASFLAPVYEEFIFRGLYTPRKIFKIISIILLPLFILLSDSGWLSIVLLVLFGLSYIISLKTGNNKVKNVSLFLNILVFTSVHYKVEEFIDPSLFYYAFFQFALGSLFLWLILNFGIFKAILSHVIWNTTMMIFLLIGLQYPDEEINKFENSQISVSWKRVPKFADNTSTIKEVNDDSLIATNTEARMLYKILSLKSDKEVPASIRILQTENYMKYNFEVVKKEENAKISTEAMNFLTEEGLIYLLEK